MSFKVREAGEESRGYSDGILRRYAPPSYAEASADKQDDRRDKLLFYNFQNLLAYFCDCFFAVYLVKNIFFFIKSY